MRSRIYLMIIVPAMLVLCSPDAGLAQSFRLTSPAITSGQPIPTKFTCAGNNLSPPLNWSGVPQGTGSLALIVTDPDAPIGTVYHWVAYNIPPSSDHLPEAVPPNGAIPGGGQQGINQRGRPGYTGPCPPPGKAHNYHFTLYAVDQSVKAAAAERGPALLSTIKDHLKGTAELIAPFSHKPK